MKPLVLISGLGPGGAERVTVSLLAALQGSGPRAIACTVTDRHDGPLADELVREGVDRRDLGARRLADPSALFRLVRLLASEGVDLVHAHGQDAAILAWWAASLVRTRLVVTRHVLEEPEEGWRQRARARLALRAFHAADSAVAVSDAAADRLSRLSGLGRDRIRVLHNGIDLATFAAVDRRASREGLTRSLGLPVGTPLVLLPAVIRPGKGHVELLDALPGLRARIPEVRVLLAGSGELEDVVQRRASAFGDQVRFLGHRTDVPELMAAADVVVLPSRAEALPTVLMEAAAAGRPVVATEVGGVPEIVESGKTGLLVPPDDPSALSAALARLLEDRELADGMGTRARAAARERFGLDRQAHGTVALWEETMGRAPT